MEPARLIIASSRASYLPALAETAKKTVIVVTYKYETCTLGDILVLIHKSVSKNIRVASIGMFMHCSEKEIFLCFSGGKTISGASDSSVNDFLSYLVDTFMTPTNRRLDFFNASLASNTSGERVTRELQKLLKLPVGIWKDVLGAKLDSRLDIASLYFNVALLREKLQAEKKAPRDWPLEGYEKIRTVGKGAFGTAVLYRRISDGLQVVIKEVNMVDLTATERQMALNEVQVLSLLDHPNIISYYGSFERDGVLMIEMEYADKGTLAQMLSQRAKRLDEKQILLLFRQIVEAIRYMHEHNILHRDLKTANVFLNEDNSVKVGDFGISKVMTTRVQAHTVLGTPYYISPEMCEGKQYDQKSDLWALGCILYEMACLQKTFEGSNLPALVNKIMKGHFAPVPVGYSQGFRQLIHDLLQRDPVFRPTAAEILNLRLPKLFESLLGNDGGEWFLDHNGTLPRYESPSFSKSVLYELQAYKSAISLTPIQLPPRVTIKDVSVSNTHMIALTTEMLVYTWGEGKRGELGHGEMEPWRNHPCCVDALKGKSITHIAAGEGYSVFVSESGMVMSCGDGTFGCLGHGEWNNSLRPKLVEKLLSVDVAILSCGTHHVAVLSGDNRLYTWGRGDGGRLGLGHQEDCCSPVEVALPRDCVVRTLRCGGDGTAIINTDGAVWVCGHNTNNKLGLSEKRVGFLSNTFQFHDEIKKVLTFTPMKSVKSRVADISLGLTHTAILTESGHVVTLGNNSEGQLGRGHQKSKEYGPAIVKSLADKVVTMVKCGPTYTVVGTIENAVYFWGTRYGSFFNQDLGNSLVPSGVWASSKSKSKPTSHEHQVGFQYTSSLNVSNNHFNKMADVILEPQELLALYASPSQVAKRETIGLVNVYSRRHSVLVLVETTTPLVCLPHTDHSELSVVDADKPLAQHDQVPLRKAKTPKTPDLDTVGPIPNWIKAEIDQSEVEWAGFHESQRRLRTK